MVVMAPREKWTDERLDDLNKKVDKGFEETKAEFKDVRREMKEGFARVDGEFKDVRRDMDVRFTKVDERLDKVADRFLDLNRILLGGTLAIIATLIGGQVFG
jgi:ribosome recycling factor